MEIGGVASIPPQMAFLGHGGTDMVSPSTSIAYVVGHELAHKSAAEMAAVAAGGRAEVDIEIQFAWVNGRLVATGGVTRSRTVVDKKVSGIPPTEYEGAPDKTEEDPLKKDAPSETNPGSQASVSEPTKSQQIKTEVTGLKQKMQDKTSQARAIEARIEAGGDPLAATEERDNLRQVKGEVAALRGLIQVKEAQVKMEDTLKKMVTADQRAFADILNLIIAGGLPQKGAILQMMA